MVLPILALGAVALGASIGGAVFGGSDKSQQNLSLQSTQNTSIDNTQISNQFTEGDITYNPVTNIGSGSIDNAPVFKKTQSLATEQESKQTAEPSLSASAEQAKGTDLTKIALIGGAVVAGIMIFGDDF